MELSPATMVSAQARLTADRERLATALTKGFGGEKQVGEELKLQVRGMKRIFMAAKFHFPCQRFKFPKILRARGYKLRVGTGFTRGHGRNRGQKERRAGGDNRHGL